MTQANSRLNRRAFISALGAAGAGAAVSGCASSGPSAFYSLAAADVGGVTGRSNRVQVLVAPPRALKALDTTHIAVVDSGPVYSYFPDVAWADTLPNVVQNKLLQTLQNTGRLRGVGLPGDGLLIDYQLQTDIRAFEFNVDGANRGVVEIAARVVNDRNGRTVANKVFRRETPSGSSDVNKAVAAMNRSAEQVFADIAAWTLRNV
jgi:cholesterol transport system auxiliary component